MATHKAVNDYEDKVEDANLCDHSISEGTLRPKHVFTTAILEHSLDVSREGEASQYEIFGLCLMRDKLIVCDNHNSKLKVFDSPYKFLYEYRCDKKPHDICIIDNDTVVVSSLDGRNMKVLSVSNDGMKELKTINTEYACYGVCCYKGHIYCVVKDTKDLKHVSQVLVYTPDGQIKRRFENLSDGNIECNNLYYITVNPKDGILYLSDWDKGVLALSTSGDVLKVICTAKLEKSQGIAVDDNGHIYVCSGVHSHNVIQMSQNGEHMKEILSKNVRSSRAQVVKISGDKLFLARFRSRVISIYRLS